MESIVKRASEGAAPRVPDPAEGLDGGLPRIFAQVYRLDALLGKGGGGAVYRAWHIQREQACALKVLSRRLARDFDAVRFKREFRAASRLRHPFCVQVYEAGETDDSQFLSMELMAGGDLSSWHAPRPEHVAGVALQVLAALDHIHARTIVHRDIKPENILLRTPAAADAMPRVALADFGIAKVADLDEQQSAASTLGSLAYIAPEQLIDASVDPRSDLFALGVVLYELLAGRLPLTPRAGGTVSEWIARRHEAVPPVHELNPAIASELNAFIMRLLQPNPQQRFVTAAAAHAALLPWLRSVDPGAVLDYPPLQDAAYLASAQFVGRASEMQTVRQFIEDLQTNPRGPANQVLCISGDAGIGKTKLLTQAIRLAELNSIRVGVGACRSEPGPAFESVAGLMQALADPANEEVVSEEDEGGSTLVGKQSDGDGVLEQLADPGKSDERWEMYRRLAERLLQIGAEQPCLFALEDAQWADVATLQFLTFLLRATATARRQGRPARVAFILTHRPADSFEALAELYETARREAVLLDLPLRPLSDDAATELVGSMLMASSDAAAQEQVQAITARVAAGAENNPLFLAQVLRSLLTRHALRRDNQGWVLDVGADGAGDLVLPRTIRDAIGERAVRFSVHTKQMLAVGAVLGRRFELSLLQALTSLDEAALLDSLDEALREGFIDEQRGVSGAYLFAHDRFRESIYERMDVAQRITWHRNVALELERRDDVGHRLSADLAHHWRHSNDPAKAYPHGVEAATQSVANYAYEQGISHYRAAFDDAKAARIIVQPALRESFADVCNLAGFYNDAEQVYRSQVDAAATAAERIAALRKLGQLEYRRGNMREAASALEDVLRMLGRRIPTNRISMAVRFAWAFASTLVLMLPGLRRSTQRQGEGVRQLEEACETYAFLAQCYYFDNFLSTAYYAFSGYALAMQLGPCPAAVTNVANAGYAMAHIGQSRLSHTFLQIANTWASRAAGRTEQGWLLLMTAMVALVEGRLDAVIDISRNAQRLLVEARNPMFLRTALMFEAEALLSQGHVDLAYLRAEALWQLACEVNDLEGRGFAKYLLAEVDARRGRIDRSLQGYAESIQFAQGSGGTLSRIVTNARLQFERALSGAEWDAFERARSDATECTRRGLRGATCQIYAVAAIAGAKAQLAGRALPADARAFIRGTLRRHAAEARLLPCLRPLFYAAEGTWAWAEGRHDAAHGHIARAIAECDRLGMHGELANVLRLARTWTPATDQHFELYQARLAQAQGAVNQAVEIAEPQR